jgi:hypothetical protein
MQALVATRLSFIERLKREIKASPKKAAMLGLVCLVAVWFWTPLVLKWSGKKSATDDIVAAGGEESIVDPVATAAPTLTTNDGATATATPPTASWQKILKWINSDPKMKPHVATFGRRDPFAPTAARSTAKLAETAPEQKAPDVTPQEAGISVSSTVVGIKNRTALINGRAYREEQQVAGSKSQDKFLLVEIRSKSVVLERNDKRYEVKIPKLESVLFDQ